MVDDMLAYVIWPWDEIALGPKCGGRHHQFALLRCASEPAVSRGSLGRWRRCRRCRRTWKASNSAFSSRWQQVRLAKLAPSLLARWSRIIVHLSPGYSFQGFHFHASIDPATNVSFVYICFKFTLKSLRLAEWWEVVGKLVAKHFSL